MNHITPKIKKTNHTMPLKIREYLFKKGAIVIANKKYLLGINIFEKYRKKYNFDDNQNYRLALFYDHAATSAKNKKYFNKYLKRAKIIYQAILKNNPNYFHALYGIGRIYRIKKNYKKALKYQIAAYNKMIKLPKPQRGALAIGLTYEEIGDYKNAEKWYKKEIKLLPKNDFGGILNIFYFYKKNHNYKMALFNAIRLEKLLKKEYEKNIYKNLKMKNSDFLKKIKDDIKEIKISIKNGVR